MVSDLFFSALLLLALLWLCVLLPYAWPSDRPVGYQRTPTSATPPRQRSRDPQPFPGLLHKPHGAACEQAAQEPAAPPPIPSTAGRPRQVDTSQPFYPTPDCASQGRVGLGTLSTNGHPSGGLWRPWHCTACKGYVQETPGTLFHGQRVAPDLLVWTVGALAEGLGIRAVARVFAVDPNTALS